MLHQYWRFFALLPRLPKTIEKLKIHVWNVAQNPSVYTTILWYVLCSAIICRKPQHWQNHSRPKILHFFVCH